MSMPPPPPPGDRPAYGGYAQPHPRGTLILVLGIISIFCFGIILGPIAAVMGKNALTEIDANPGAYTNRGLVQVGMILGIVAIVLWVIGLIVQIAAG